MDSTKSRGDRKLYSISETYPLSSQGIALAPMNTAFAEDCHKERYLARSSAHPRPSHMGRHPKGPYWSLPRGVGEGGRERASTCFFAGSV